VLGNDHVFEWAASALANLRSISALPITLIPFDDNTRRTQTLARRMGVTILDLSPAVTEATREAAQLLWPGNMVVASLLRKVAVFEGPYERFVFVDIDQLFMQDIPSLMVNDLRTNPDLDVIAGWCDPGQTWAPGWDTGAVSDSNGISMSTGLWASRAGLFTPGQLVDAARYVAEHDLQTHFAHVGDQPLINVTLTRIGARHKMLPDLHPETSVASNWSGHHKWWLPKLGRPTTMHWAGEPLPVLTMPATNLYLRWRLAAPHRLRGLTETCIRTMRRAQLGTAR
jgi:hypothetical protein